MRGHAFVGPSIDGSSVRPDAIDTVIDAFDDDPDSWLDHAAMRTASARGELRA